MNQAGEQACRFLIESIALAFSQRNTLKKALNKSEFPEVPQ